jgi:hypothetical protein
MTKQDPKKDARPYGEASTQQTTTDGSLNDTITPRRWRRVCTDSDPRGQWAIYAWLRVAS